MVYRLSPAESDPSLITDHLRAFLFQVPASLVAIVAVSLALVLPKSNDVDFKAAVKRVDFKGSVALILTVFFLLFGLDRGGNVAWDDRTTLGFLLAAFVMLFAFVAIELWLAAEPVAPKHIVAHRSLFACYMANFLGMAASLSMLFHVSLYLQAVEGLTPSRAGLWLLPSILGGVVGSLAGGIAVQKTGRYYHATLLGYGAFAYGLASIVLSTGVVVRSFVGIAIGEGTPCFFLLAKPFVLIFRLCVCS